MVDEKRHSSQTSKRTVMGKDAPRRMGMIKTHGILAILVVIVSCCTCGTFAEHFTIETDGLDKIHWQPSGDMTGEWLEHHWKSVSIPFPDIPTDGFQVRISGGLTANLSQDGAKAASVSVGKRSIVFGIDNNDGTLNISGGNLTIQPGPTYNYIWDGQYRIGQRSVGIVNQTDGDVIVAGDPLNRRGILLGGTAGSGDSEGHGTYNLSGGTITSGKNLILGEDNSIGIMNQSGGSIDIAKSLVLSPISAHGYTSGFSTYHINGGSLTVTDDIFIAESDKTSLFIVEGDTTDITTLTGGSLRFGAMAQLIFIAGDEGIKPFEILDEVELGGTLDIDLSNLTASSNEIVLIDQLGDDPLNTLFANASEGSLYSSPVGIFSLTYGFANNGGTANDLALIRTSLPIPEPSMLVLVGVLGLTFGVQRCRRPLK